MRLCRAFAGTYISCRGMSDFLGRYDRDKLLISYKDYESVLHPLIPLDRGIPDMLAIESLYRFLKEMYCETF